MEFLRAHRERKLFVIPVGKKGRDALRKRNFSFLGEYVNVLVKVEFSTAQEIAALVNELYSSAQVDAVYIAYSEFKNVIAPKLMLEKLLPVETLREEDSSGEGAGAPQVDYIYEQPAADLLSRLLPRYVETQVFHAMLESSAAEYAARMTAMDSATNNAGEVIDALTLHMNKVRQAAITKEIIEIIGGAASTA